LLDSGPAPVPSLEGIDVPKVLETTASQQVLGHPRGRRLMCRKRVVAFVAFDFAMAIVGDYIWYAKNVVGDKFVHVLDGSHGFDQSHRLWLGWFTSVGIAIPILVALATNCLGCCIASYQVTKWL